MIGRILISLAMCAVIKPYAYAYELGTHGALTYEAYKRSALVDNEALMRLGVDDGANPFGTVYYDISGSDVRTRTRQPFEEDQRAKRMPLGTEPLSIEGWLMRGAIREDDAYKEANPQDDPYPANARLRRPLHHFYDPINDCGLFVNSCSQNLIETGIFGLGALDPDIHKAPDWAIGASDAFADVNSPEVGRRNHFTLFDAREALYRALTGLNQLGEVVAATEAERKAYWATTFRALGDVVHLIQDMAQPQHTRNDRHAGKTPQSVSGPETFRIYNVYRLERSHV